MREFVATVTSKGQLTLPVGVRRQLGIAPGDRVSISLDSERAELRRVEYRVDAVRGLIPALPGVTTDDFDDLIDDAMSDHAAEIVRRMGEGWK